MAASKTVPLFREYMNGKWFAVKEMTNIALEGNKLRNNAFV
jgi:hypothetical protein